MIVQITSSRFRRDSILDYDSEGINQVYYKYITLKYEFITLHGYSGYIESPRLWINFFSGGNNMRHEYLNVEDGADLWYTLIDPTPYMTYTEDEYGYHDYENHFGGKYFYKIRFQNGTWVKLDFNNIVIKQLEPSVYTDYLNIKSFLICPTNICDITQIETDKSIQMPDYNNNLPIDIF